MVKYRGNSPVKARILARWPYCYRPRNKLVKPLKYILILLVSLSLWGCSSNDELPDMADTGEQGMYEDIQRYLKNESYNEAVRGLQLLESLNLWDYLIDPAFLIIMILTWLRPSVQKIQPRQ